MPVYADVEEATQLISVSSALECVTDRTMAIMATHLYGGLADVSALRNGLQAMGRDDVVLVEDCAQAHGAGYEGSRAGSRGDLAAFSFYPTKNLGAMGDAGVIVTSSDRLAATARRLHQYGWSSKYTIAAAGGRNSRMDEIQAAVLACLLPRLNEYNKERSAILATYAAACPPHMRPLDRPPGSVVHLAVVLCDRRDELRSFLGARGISTEIHYPILDCDQPGWQAKHYRLAPRGIPASRRSSTKLLSLPCFIGMTQDEIDHVSQALGEFPS